MQETATTITSWAAAIHHALRAQNIAPDPLFEAAGLDPALLGQADARYPVSGMTRLWALALQASGDPAFPLSLPQHVQPGTLHGLGMAIVTSQTLRDAARRLERFSAIVSTAALVRVSEEGGTMVLELVPDCETADAALEAFLATILHIVRNMLQQSKLIPQKVELRSKLPTDAAPYTAFFGLPVHFAEQRWALQLDGRDMDKPLPLANAAIATATDAVVRDYLARFADDIVRRTRQAILEQLTAGLPSLEDVAERLLLSPRSLQRQLADANLSYSKLRDAVQQEMAEQWLAHSERSLTEITFRLGFSDQSNFSKAFKRWTGLTPGQYRAQQS